MKKQIFSFLIGLVIGFIFFWGSLRYSIYLYPSGVPHVIFGNFLYHVFSGDQVMVIISYLIIGLLGFLVYWLIVRILQKDKASFPLATLLFFLAGFIIPFFLLLLWAEAIASAFSHWQLFI